MNADTHGWIFRRAIEQQTGVPSDLLLYFVQDKAIGTTESGIKKVTLPASAEKY